MSAKHRMNVSSAPFQVMFCCSQVDLTGSVCFIPIGMAVNDRVADTCHERIFVRRMDMDGPAMGFVFSKL